MTNHINSPFPLLPQQPTQISFDHSLLTHKRQLLQQYLQNQSQKQQLLTNYPNEQLQILAKEHIKEHGKIQMFKSNNTVYFGEICNQHYHGYGLLIYKGKKLRFYQGSFQNNCKYGYGMEYINGDVYIGKFLNNKPEDQNGIFIWNNGDLYHGSFVSGMKHGIGKWQSGEQFYSGTWKFNKPEGQGFIRSALSQYSGDIKNGYKHGQGIQLFNNGDRYQGMYSNGKPQGQGSYAWNNGSNYKGQFKNGLRFGYGIWKYGAQKYEGNYVNDKRNGEGTYTWSGGSYYQGTFVEDLRHGFGEMHWDQDSYYKGEWIEGMQSGQGEIWEKGKLTQKGIFQNGKIKIQTSLDQSQERLPQFAKKLTTQKRTQILPVFADKKRFNSFQSKNEQYRNEAQKKDRYYHQSFYDKQNQAILERKRQINKRYSFFDKNNERRAVSHALRHPLKKSNEKSVGEQENSRSKQKVDNFKTSIAKIQLYKKLRKERKTEPIAKKINTTNKMPKSFEREVIFETQLAPIKWKNFSHVGSH